MIKFFRKIRQKLLIENRFNKYLLYAIGEIVLVVIGILIALQINNWNQQYQNSKKEKNYLKDFKDEFLSDKKVLDRYILLTETKLKSGRNVKDFLAGNSEINSYLLNHLFFNGRILVFYSRTPKYDEMLSSGQMDIIKNDSLISLIKDYKNHINRLKEFLYDESKNIKASYNLHLYKYFDYEIITHLWANEFRKDALELTKGFKKDFEGFKNDSRSYYHVSTVMGTDSELNRAYKDGVSKRLNQILEILEKETVDD